MPTFNITNQISGVDLGNYQGTTPYAAADEMARHAGYKSYRDMCSITDPENLDEKVDEQFAKFVITEVE